MNELEDFIKAQGWSFYGVADIDSVNLALEKHKGVFEEWVINSYQANMDYLDRMKEDRFHPENKLPEVNSIIVLGAWYASGDSNMVARYARGKDYHKVLKKKLITLSDWLKEGDSTAEAYLSVDSGPTVDRVLAETAGLGFFGKNCSLIHPVFGSYFFIASLMTTLRLDPTPKKPMPDCGSCQNCQVACPTGAFVRPGFIDARRCVSYLTIENKEGIPAELRSKIGNRLFGCDSCQACCPFNQGRKEKQVVHIEAFKSENGVGESLDLKEILSIQTDEAFLRRFAGTPLMRAKKIGLLRNACIVAGNSGDKTFIPYLEALIEREDDPMLKEHAEWGISELN